MIIKEFISQSRRDLTLLFECEHCGYSFKGNGYDDENFHNNVVPDMECKNCGKKADKESYRAFAPKYPESLEV